MLFRKTPTTERDNYVYRFNDGTVSVIAEGSEAEVWIKSLHSFDAAEVYNNIKNSRPQLEPWQKKALEEWKAQHPGEEPDKNWNLSMDGLMMTEDPDTSVYAKQLAEMTAEEPDPQKELLYEKLSELPEEDQELYRLYYIEEYSQEQIAKMKGVSQNTVSKKLRRIAKQLTEMFSGTDAEAEPVPEEKEEKKPAKKAKTKEATLAEVRAVLAEKSRQGHTA